MHSLFEPHPYCQVNEKRRKDDFAQWCKTHRADDADVVIHFFESAANFTRNQDKLPDWISQVKKILRRAT